MLERLRSFREQRLPVIRRVREPVVIALSGSSEIVSASQGALARERALRGSTGSTIEASGIATRAAILRGNAVERVSSRGRIRIRELEDREFWLKILPEVAMFVDDDELMKV